MTEKTLHITGIGNAIVDVMSYVDEDFITRHRLTKGAMTLIDETQAETLYKAMGTCAECSGGSVANTMAGLASFGGKGAFIGKIADDAVGAIFKHDMRATGITFDTTYAPKSSGSTAHCLVVVTPDAERTMQTHLGVAALIREPDINESHIAAAEIVYIEGYLWDVPETIQALRHAIAIAKKHGTKVAFTLSDTFCVERHRASFRALIEDDLDILFANESEITTLFETDNFEDAAAAIKGSVGLACLTRSEKGSWLVTPEERIHVEAGKVIKVEDTTGAGDLYAAGVLYGLTHGYPLHEAGRLGSAAAAQIIQHLGARPLKPLKSLVVG